MSDTSAEQTQIRLVRISLPRFEVRYPSRESALADARTMLGGGTFLVPAQIDELAGATVVLDLTAQGIPLRTTLLFRVAERVEAGTRFAWHSRRQTDPDILALWIDALSPTRTSDFEAVSVPAAELQRLYEVCRRARTPNPFVALGIGPASDVAASEEGYRSIARELARFSAIEGLPERAREMVDAAKRALPSALDKMRTADGRRSARLTWLQPHELQGARDLAASRLAIAKVLNDPGELAEAEAAVAELG